MKMLLNVCRFVVDICDISISEEYIYEWQCLKIIFFGEFKIRNVWSEFVIVIR